MFNVRLVDNIQALCALESAWRAVVAADTQASLCSTWEWTSAWLAQFWQAEYAPRVFVIEQLLATDEPRPVGLLPLYLNGATGELLLLGTGEPEACEVASEYLDLLLDERRLDTDSAWALLLPLLRRGGWRQLRLFNVLVTSRLQRLLRHCPRARGHAVGCQYGIDLRQSLPAVMAQFSYKQRKNGQLLLNRYDKSSNFACEVLTEDADGTRWQALRLLHQADWTARAKPGVFADARFDAFHARLPVQAAAQQEQPMRLYSVLRYEGEIIAVHYYLRWRGRLYFYQSGTVKDRLQQYSPGKLLHMLALRELAGSGLYYDFMKGAHHGSYKAALCPRGPDFLHIEAFPPGLLGGIRWQWACLKERWRRRRRTAAVATAE